MFKFTVENEIYPHIMTLTSLDNCIEIIRRWSDSKQSTLAAPPITTSLNSMEDQYNRDHRYPRNLEERLESKLERKLEDMNDRLIEKLKKLENESFKSNKGKKK